jgi:hypothetical protein
MNFIIAALQNPKTSIAGILALLVGLSTLFGELSELFHALSISDFNGAIAELKPLGTSFGLVSAGILGLAAKDATISPAQGKKQ